ncbi:MAG: hypothetical protein A2017_15330 [Lentisphaerae bacterium GWF2_44_16]|nr:MAG: hypothetical protein A2017_15330 [Lentisphaerae bacterium GWF2_44_16]
MSLKINKIRRIFKVKGFIFSSILSVVCFFSPLFGEEVTVTGMAEGNPDTARELALANALREAVRQGAGVDILSESKVQNFQMEYDRVITSSFGYVEEYKVLANSYNPKKKEYTVKIKAKVTKGAPQMDQVLALRMLVRRMQSPRVMVECTEEITGEGIVPGSSLSSAVLEEMAQKTGFEIFKKTMIKERDEKDAARAELLGDSFDAKVKKAGITSTSDFKILANVKGQVGPMKEPFPDVKVRDVAIGVDLQAVWTDTGEIAATVSLPTTYHKGESQMNLPFDMPQQLFRHYLLAMLTGSEPAFKQNNAYNLFRRIIAKWITELDLGAKIQLEFKQIDKNTLDKLIAELEKTPNISYVWRREFDQRLFSVLEIETRLNSQQVEEAVLKQLGNKYTIDVATKRRLRFIPKK